MLCKCAALAPASIIVIVLLELITAFLIMSWTLLEVRELLLSDTKIPPFDALTAVACSNRLRLVILATYLLWSALEEATPGLWSPRALILILLVINNRRSRPPDLALSG